MRWCSDVAETGAILDGILSIVHPALYDSAVEFQGTNPAEWPTCYHGVEVIANREALFHRHVNGRPGWLDMLCTVGEYKEDAVLALRSLGASVPYDPGSIVLLDGSLVVHGVPHVEGDRLAYVWVMSRHVLAQHDAPPGPDWAMCPEVAPYDIDIE